MSSFDYPQGRESSHTHRPLADPACKLSYVVVSSSGVQKKLVNPVKGEGPIDLGLERQEIIDSINERAAEHAHHHHHHEYHDEFGPGSTAYHDGAHAHGHGHGHGHGHDHVEAHANESVASAAASPDPIAKSPMAAPGLATAQAEPSPASTASAAVAFADVPVSAAKPKGKKGKKASKASKKADKKDKKGKRTSDNSEAAKADKKTKPDKKELKAALKAAAVNESAKKFAKMWAARNQEGGISQAGCFESSGCYAILRYPKGEDKPTRFTSAYVGGSHNMGASVMRHLQGEGNPDVYADAKYGKNLRVLLYPYPEDQLRAKSHELSTLLNATR